MLIHGHGENMAESISRDPRTPGFVILYFNHIHSTIRFTVNTCIESCLVLCTETCPNW